MSPTEPCHSPELCQHPELCPWPILLTGPGCFLLATAPAPCVGSVPSPARPKVLILTPHLADMRVTESAEAAAAPSPLRSEVSPGSALVRRGDAPGCGGAVGKGCPLQGQEQAAVGWGNAASLPPC